MSEMAELLRLCTFGFLTSKHRDHSALARRLCGVVALTGDLFQPFRLPGNCAQCLFSITH